MDLENKNECHWKATYNIVPRLEKTESINGYNFIVSNEKMIVEVEYKTSSYDEKLPDAFTETEYAEETIAKKHQINLRELMLKRMIYLETSLPIKVDYKITRINEQQVFKTGRHVELHYTLHVLITEINDSIIDSINYWNSGFQGRIANYEDDVIRIADWLERSASETDDIKRFMLAWIGFNGLFGIWCEIDGSQELNDAEKIEKLINNFFSYFEAERIYNKFNAKMSYLATLSIKSKKGNVDWSLKLSEEMAKSNPSYMEVLNYTLKCIYGVRRQVFHEAPQTEDILKTVQHCTPIIAKITSFCLKKLIAIR